jgi:glycosyltransferase involved in cell wall biosynthesis
MKIAVSTLSDVSTNVGTSVRAKHVFELLQKEYDCTLIIRGRGQSKADNVKIIRPSKLWNLQLIPVVLKNRFNLIYCCTDLWGFFTYFILARFWPCKVVFEAHGIASLERQYGLPDPSLTDMFRIEMLKWREKFVVKHADCVIALSSDICRFYGRLNKCIFLVPNFVDERKYQPQKSSIERRSDEKERRNVGLIGPFVQNNINNYILDFVYKNIGKFDERIKFRVIGECDCKIMNERISYTGYLNDFQDYIDQLALLDAVLVASKFPSFGPLTKILEPMACSLPVFTTPVGAAGLDHVTAGEDIFICEESAIVAKVNESLFDVNLMESVGKKARSTIETYYGAAANYRKLTEVIDRLCIP